MALSLGSPQSWQELDEAFAAIQTWLGKHEGLGKWQDIILSAGDMFVTAGTTWIPAYANITRPTFRYAIIGPTMVVSFYFGSTLSAALANLNLRLPRRVTVGGPGVATYLATCSIVDNGVASIGTVSTEQGRAYLTIAKMDGSDFNGPTVLVGGQVLCDVVGL